MANTFSRRRIAQFILFFLAGIATLLFANLWNSIVIAVAHSAAFLYHLGPPDLATQRALAALIRVVGEMFTLVLWTVVLGGAALLNYRTRAASLGHFVVYVSGSWLAALPFTLLPEYPEMHAVAPQFGRFSILSLLTLVGASAGARLRDRAERRADVAWLIREAQSPEKLVQALGQIFSSQSVQFALFSRGNDEGRSLSLSADSNSFESRIDPHSCAEFIDWPLLLRDESFVADASQRLHASLPGRTWWYLLSRETQPSVLLLIAPKRAPLFSRGRHHYQAWADLAGLSLRQQERVHHAQQRAREGERKQVSYEIHERLAQDLISGLMQFEAARTYLGGVTVEAERSLEAVEATLRRALDETRQIAWNLHQTTPSGPLLSASLERAVQEFRGEHNGSAEFLLVGDEQPLSSPCDAILTAGLREALSNIRKHAMAQSVQVTLSYINGSVALDVCDNGRGMSKSPLRALIGHGGFGLHALRRRVEGAGGRLVLEGGSVRGTTLSIHFPAGAGWN